MRLSRLSITEPCAGALRRVNSLKFQTDPLPRLRLRDAMVGIAAVCIRRPGAGIFNDFIHGNVSGPIVMLTLRDGGVWQWPI